MNEQKGKEVALDVAIGDALRLPLTHDADSRAGPGGCPRLLSQLGSREEGLGGPGLSSTHGDASLDRLPLSQRPRPHL